MSARWGRAAAIATSKKAKAKAADLAPFIEDIIQSGITILAGIAGALTERGISTPSGRGHWHPATVQRVIART